MTEINEAGYQTHRAVVNSSATPPDQWDYLELRDDTGSVVTRVSITSDSRAQWTSTITDQTQVAEITVTGSDADISPTVTIVESALKTTDSDTADDMHSDTTDEATIANDSDQVTWTHSIEVPEVV